MNRKLLLGAALAALTLGGAAFGLQAWTDSDQPTLDPVSLEAPALPESTKTLMLTVQLDATDGVQVLQATPKPELDFQMPRHWARLPLQWTMFDAAGTVLARGGFDPHLICLDPAHAGAPPHMKGDQVVPHVCHNNVKVPALADFDRIEFRWAGRSGAPSDRPRPLGVLAASTLSIR